MAKTERQKLIEAVAVTAELLDTQLTDAAAKVMVDDLSVYPPNQVFAALQRCRREVKGRLTLSEIVSRLDDGRPGPEEAWALIPKGEGDSVMWSAEMRQAFGVAQPLLESGDEIGARMAFKEAYQAAVTQARTERRAPEWQLSQGYSHPGELYAQSKRKAAVLEAVERGRIGHDTAQALLPDYREPVTDAPRLSHDGEPTPASEAMEHIELMKQLYGPTKQEAS